jgi:hypothetical protein
MGIMREFFQYLALFLALAAPPILLAYLVGGAEYTKKDKK